MNKREADTILLACKKHGIFMTMRKEGSVYVVNFIKRIEIRSFEGAKLITNGLVLDGKLKKDVKKQVVELGTNAKLIFSNYPTRKKKADSGISWADRRRIED
jgi:hypothetical protein